MMPNNREAIVNCAESVEAYLDSKEIALTMGGEPTFIVAQPDTPEWSVAAMGPEKLGYARRMTANLIEKVYPGALAMQIFGKWYPGEPLPRWNFMTLYDAKEPLWLETERLLFDDVAGSNVAENGNALMQALAAKLELQQFVLPAVEEHEGTVGWVLPLNFVEGVWAAATWPFCAEDPVELFAGDSPVGLRLPLDELPEDVSRSALTIEVRDGAIEIFIPPLEWPGFRELIGLLRGIVVDLDLKDIVICGYGPSETEGALTTLGLAADPGVLEVNLPPTATWVEYDQVLQQCATAAAKVKLQLTKFQLNGAIYGTGGGSHLAFGGPDEARNPFLVDPKRIASLLRYWQHHPALSYFFTGQHVGPGSQAPRVDEGPRHGLYELEVACEGLENMQGLVDGPLIDQFFKNLLTDSSGNTHRAELCFDKFHNLAAPNGCLGIVEFRAFETYASADTMSVVALFVRTILARLFKAPFKEELIRFGPQLHDRYFLPAFLWEDVQAICADLQAYGFPFDAEWLRPVFEFRCPTVGILEVAGGSVDVRQAFESWPLMAEEAQGSSTVRVVDNSSDRLQLTLSDGKLLEKGMLLVNGVEVPFEEVDGRMICGLRYKSASAYPALHPHVPIQSPLWIEWVDRQSGQTTHAARYHYWNPNSLVYDGRPQTVRAAEERREERWLPADDLIGNQPDALKAKLAPEYKYTLDLRRQLRV
ncbi:MULTISPECIES: transglutaminase family protein [unclassified Lentimonas]|uniref:transglutaminase family protein n=1 Tax=unclassified Lentimonas TaxID=2630993 RepID=UPI001325F8D1|nr:MULTISPECIES: transglutaminase family protein [unclassified Lentimonas]CAA6695062.1 Large protein containing transglutaminase-like domain [Lentimonas sp. CC19]CAA6697183.1 Large protein containing transglutaminase-like domain [Lentimonas sp. CC10]CAA7069839.1 Large protein containing transglutaminase-like domain [Lentimonas sp. CC11]